MKGKKVLKTISLLFTSILTVFIIVFGLIYFVLLNPEKNFYKLFNKVFDATEKIVAKGSVQGFSTSINKGNIKFDSNIEKYEGLKDYEIEYDVENDRKNNISYIDLKFGDEEENIESTFYYEDKNLFIEFPYIHLKNMDMK